jgi:hypothetical protein
MIDLETLSMEPSEATPRAPQEPPVREMGAVGVYGFETSQSPDQVGVHHAEVEGAPHVLLTKDDIFDIAVRHGFSDKLAGRTWNLLTRLFTLKDNAAYYREKSWYDKDGYDYVPLVFERIPEERVFGRYNSDDLSDLQADSLAKLLSLYDAASERVQGTTAKTEVRHKILGEYAGKSTVTFMRKIVEVSSPTEASTS